MIYPFKILNEKKFILCFICAFIENLCIYLMPVMLSFFTKVPFTVKKLQFLIISIVGLKSAEILLNHVWIVYLLRFEEKFAKDVQLAYLRRVEKLKLYKLNKVHNGFLKKQIDIISDESAQFIEYIFETVNGFGIAMVIFFIEIINQDLKIFWICLGMIICMVIYNIWLGKRYVKVQEDYNNSYSKYNSTYVDFLQNIKTVKRLNAIKFAINKNEETFDEVVPKMNRMNYLRSLRSNGINFFVYFMYTIILVDLYFKMKSGQEVLSYLLFYATIFSGLSTELRDLSRLFLHYNRFQAATNQVENILGDDEEKNIISDWKIIQIENLDFKYNDEKNTKIFIPDFYINKGDKISIVGKSGQGKTTFLNIFSRYLEIEDENYKIDGVSRKGILNISYISQEIDLFNLTIRENLCLGKSIEDEKLMLYLKEAGLSDWVNKLENGLDTVVGERGLKLSVGQKQRFNIIRGILLDKDIYILDEPTSNLDKETEKLIISFIQKYLKDKTVIIVTHRDEIKGICSRHYEFKDNMMKEYNLI